MKGKDRLLKVLAAAAAVIIVIYFAAEMYSLTSRTYTTETVYEQTVLETVDAKMYIIRDETLLTTAVSGVTVPLADNGERVSKGSTIAAVFPSEASAENYASVESLEKKLESYRKIDSQLSLDNVDVNKLNEEINSRFISILNSVYENDYSDLGDDKLSFAEKLSRKQISLDKDVDCTAQIAELQNEISALQSSSTPSEIITAESAGYYVSKVDGYEGVLTCADVDSLTKDKLEDAFNAKKNPVQADSIGKIIDGYNWYIATVIDTAKVSQLPDAKSVDLIFSESGEEKVSTYIHSVKAIDSDESLVIFRCNLMNDSLTGLRMVDGKIVVSEYTGLKVSRDAVRLDEDGNSGVYVRRGNIVNFRSLNILYSEDDFVIASKPSEDSDIKLAYTHVKLYDEVIISGKELKDGMVI
ncbi:MAG: hypothetical protein E7547_01335 [Ruminococcaceae bacterium]|nr:hypothetical protein [Oscillospiraceae bacterium]